MNPTSLARFQESLTFPTVTPLDYDRERPDAHRAFLSFLERSYPLLHREAVDTDFGGFGRLFHIRRQTPSSGGVAGGVAASQRSERGGSAAGPILFLAHYDVVPTAGNWTYPAYGGEAADGYVWGRGALDDKSVLIALCEAAEGMLAAGRRPRRDIYLAFGGDEEAGGRRGAAKIAEYLGASGVHFDAVIDEGSTVVRGMLALVEAPLALIGVAEKGYADVVLRASGGEGHAAMPPRLTALGRLAKAIVRLDRRPFRPHAAEATIAFLKAIGTAVRGPVRLVLRRPRFFWPVLRRVLASSPGSAALLHTTHAFTMAAGSRSAATLPKIAEAVANLRILPGETVEGACRYIRRIVGDRDVEVHVVPGSTATDPTATSATSSEVYRMLAAEIGEQFSDAVVAPFLVTVTTDSKHYASLAENVYRFVPLSLDPTDLERIHGTDERISVGDFERLVRFYECLFRRIGGDQR